MHLSKGKRRLFDYYQTLTFVRTLIYQDLTYSLNKSITLSKYCFKAINHFVVWVSHNTIRENPLGACKLHWLHNRRFLPMHFYKFALQKCIKKTSYLLTYICVYLFVGGVISARKLLKLESLILMSTMQILSPETDLLYPIRNWSINLQTNYGYLNMKIKLHIFNIKRLSILN